MSTPQTDEPAARVSRPFAQLPGLLVVLLVALVATPLVVYEFARGPVISGQYEGLPSELVDQHRFHMPTIEKFARELPAVDVRSYDSASTPGYYFLMGAIYRATGGTTPGMVVMHAVNLAITLGAVWLVWAWFASWWALKASRTRAAWVAAAWTLPFALTPFTVSGGVWLTTDNSGWCMVLLALVGLFRPGVSWSPWRVLLATGFVTAAVLVRQVHLWALAPVALWSLVASPAAAFLPWWLKPKAWCTRVGGWPAFALALLAGLIPVCVMGGFYLLWGALLPVSGSVRAISQGPPNPANPAFTLSVVAAMLIFLMPFLWREVVRLRPQDELAWCAIAIGLFLSLVPETDLETLRREYGWLWILARVFPDLGSRSLFLVAASVAGALTLALLWRRAKHAGLKSYAIIALLTLLGWAIAQSANPLVTNRYTDPAVFVGVGLLVAMGARNGRAAEWVGPVVFGVLQLGFLVVSTVSDEFFALL